MCSVDSFENTTASCNMIFFDEEGVVETNAMIMATTASDCVFLCEPKARDSLSSVEQLYVSMRNFIS
ncbi:hypothetical protein D3C71_1593410 [compost metagenome]